MSEYRRNRRRSPLRAFRPTLDGKLEDRQLLSGMSLHQYLVNSATLLNNPNPRAAYAMKMPPLKGRGAHPFHQSFRVIRAAATQTIRGGQAVNVASTDGTHYRIQLGYISNTLATSANDGQGGFFTQTTPSAANVIQPTEFPQPQGTVRVYAMPGGKVGIIVDGSTDNTELTINPLPQPIRKGNAHSFAYGMTGQGHLLNVGQITVTSGRIGAIEGFHSADLSGPLVVGGTGSIDRIAFNSLQPGASITTGGDVNTLDVLQGITLNGTSISIGRDLNLLNVGQDITLSNGSQFLIGRDLGATAQPPKGTGTGSNVLTLNANVISGTLVTATNTPPPVSAYLQGNLIMFPGSAFVIGRNVDNVIYVKGDINGSSRLIIPNTTVSPASNTLITLGSVIP
jgi:hypothetical protein